MIAILQTIALPTELPRRRPHSIRYSASGRNGLTRHGVANHVRRRCNGLTALSTTRPKPLRKSRVSDSRDHGTRYTIAAADHQHIRYPPRCLQIIGDRDHCRSPRFVGINARDAEQHESSLHSQHVVHQTMATETLNGGQADKGALDARHA